ncbi:hypothetical protein C8R45DRAFT_1162571 [Mycena sanguinolenta]|nr:hypothetical protein C8R45DRAFT_1162571 [Mycena sanguinolenta]
MGWDQHQSSIRVPSCATSTPDTWRTSSSRTPFPFHPILYHLPLFSAAARRAPPALCTIEYGRQHPQLIPLTTILVPWLLISGFKNAATAATAYARTRTHAYCLHILLPVPAPAAHPPRPHASAAVLETTTMRTPWCTGSAASALAVFPPRHERRWDWDGDGTMNKMEWLLGVTTQWRLSRHLRRLQDPQHVARRLAQEDVVGASYAATFEEWVIANDKGDNARIPGTKTPSTLPASSMVRRVLLIPPFVLPYTPRLRGLTGFPSSTLVLEKASPPLDATGSAASISRTTGSPNAAVQTHQLPAGDFGIACRGLPGASPASTPQTSCGIAQMLHGLQLHLLRAGRRCDFARRRPRGAVSHGADGSALEDAIHNAMRVRMDQHDTSVLDNYYSQRRRRAQSCEAPKRGLRLHKLRNTPSMSLPTSSSDSLTGYARLPPSSSPAPLPSPTCASCEVQVALDHHLSISPSLLYSPRHPSSVKARLAPPHARYDD